MLLHFFILNASSSCGKCLIFARKANAFRKKFFKKIFKENKKKISIKFMRKSEADTELLLNNDFRLVNYK